MQNRRVVAAILTALLAHAAAADAAFTTATCLAAKLKQWGRVRKCQAGETAKALRGLPSDAQKCDLQLQTKLASFAYKAAVAGVPCRFEDGGDGTVTDYDTGLQWEQKTDDGTVHDKDRFYAWPVVDGVPNLLIDFLRVLNACESADGTVVTGGFAGHCDWRLPTTSELQRILDGTVPGCGTGGPCIDTTLFGPVGQTYDWTSTYEQGNRSDVWLANLFSGQMGAGSVFSAGSAHAVRNRF